MTWIIGSVLGSISLVILNVLSKLLTLHLSNILILGCLSLFTTGCFVYAWKTSPKQFLVVWFIQSGLVSGGAFLVNHWFIKDALSWQHVIGMLAIIGGGLLLIK